MAKPDSFSGIDPTMGLDEDTLLIAKLMQEEEDLLRAQELQNDYYAGNRPPTAQSRSKNHNTNAGWQDDAGVRAADEQRFDKLISDSRHDLFDDNEWELNEHFGGAGGRPHMGGATGSRRDDPLNSTLNDEDYKRAILESMKNARPGDITTEDEQIAKAIE